MIRYIAIVYSENHPAASAKETEEFLTAVNVPLVDADRDTLP